MVNEFKIKFNLALNSVLHLYKSPKLWLLTLLIFITTMFVLLWLNNFNLLFDVLASDISVLKKWDFIASTPKILFSAYDFVDRYLLIIISILQSINIALIIKLIKAKRKKDLAKAGSSSTIVMAITFAGVGCGACGTSLIAPIASSIGAGSAVALENLGTAILILGITLLLYSIQKLAIGMSGSYLSQQENTTS